MQGCILDGKIYKKYKNLPKQSTLTKNQSSLPIFLQSTSRQGKKVAKFELQFFWHDYKASESPWNPFLPFFLFSLLFLSLFCSFLNESRLFWSDARLLTMSLSLLSTWLDSSICTKVETVLASDVCLEGKKSFSLFALSRKFFAKKTLANT